ncbi:uncharacterized protein LOC109950824 [Prunus persica]|uniref:uncharacterized protein LOC109950824 n=1 Tax=Prunus persica TaxID=3760 RepID=UPI0009AB8BD4|nr:uncharacterized protein LOC109950824 [Prunus persica]
MDERAGRRLDVCARLGPQGDVHQRLGPQGGRPNNHRNEDREERRSAVNSQRSTLERLGPQGGQLDNPHNEDHEERRSVTHSRRTNSRRQATENLSQAQSTNTPTRQPRREGRPSEDNEEAAHPKRFSTPSFIHFKGDSDPESHLKHFKNVMILHQADDALMCKVFTITLRGAAQDWFHTLPSRSISSFKELAYVFTKEYTSYRTIKKNPDHLYNLGKKSDESLRDYIKRFKAEKANIVGCDDRIASSAFKKGLPAEHDLYRELTITPSQTLAKVYATAERYALWDDDRIAAKKSTKQEDQPTKRAGQRGDDFNNRNKDKRRSHPKREATAGENYTKFTIPIHQILAQVKNKPWKAHLEELVREGHCTEFVAKQAIQRIEDRDTAKEPPQKVIRINTILADSEESGLTKKENKRKIKQATVISQVSTDLPLAEDDPMIGFQKKDLISLDMPHNDALVISIQIAQAMVDRIHADEGSAANILQLAVIQQMGLETKINKLARSLTGFNGATTVTVGTIDLDVYSPPVISLQTFMVINEVSPYNGILGRPWIGKINAITSATHQKIRYQSLGAVSAKSTAIKQWRGNAPPKG